MSMRFIRILKTLYSAKSVKSVWLNTALFTKT